jgi:hypothetical protein
MLLTLGRNLWLQDLKGKIPNSSSVQYQCAQLGQRHVTDLVQDGWLTSETTREELIEKREELDGGGTDVSGPNAESTSWQGDSAKPRIMLTPPDWESEGVKHAFESKLSALCKEYSVACDFPKTPNGHAEVRGRKYLRRLRKLALEEIAAERKRRRGGQSHKPKGLSKQEWVRLWAFKKDEIAIEARASEERIEEVFELTGIDKFAQLAEKARIEVFGTKVKDLLPHEKSPTLAASEVDAGAELVGRLR